MAATRGRSGGKRRADSSVPFGYETYGSLREAMPTPIVSPPPVYPPIDLKALPLKITEVNQYLLTLKQEFRQSLVSSVYYIKPEKQKPKIERYSDKYENIANKNVINESDVKFDWRRFPSELCAHRPSKPTHKSKNIKSIDKILSDLPVDDNEDNQSDKSDDEKHSNENSGDEENELEEDKELEDVEEGTDYTFSYFDNGENYLEESDDNMDEGPTYG